MADGRTGRSGLLRWVVVALVVLLLAGGGAVAALVVSDDGGRQDDAAQPGDGPSDPGDDGSGDSTDDGSQEPDQPVGDEPAVGAAALGLDPKTSAAGVPVDQATGPIVPDPADGNDDLPDLYADDCQLGPEEYKVKPCAYGVPRAQARATVAVVGDSKAAQWLPALQVLGERYDWHIDVYTKSACPAVIVPVALDGEIYRSCTAFNRQVQRRLVRDPVDLVFTVSGRGTAVKGRKPDGKLSIGSDRLAAGLQQGWKTWANAGSKVLVVSDTPKPVDPEDGTDIFDVPACVEEHVDDLTACTFDRQAGVDLGGYNTQLQAVREIGARNLTPALSDQRVRAQSRRFDVSWVDVVPWVCPTETCPAVIGNELVYRNGSHLTKTYVESMAPLLEKAIAVIGRERRTDEAKAEARRNR